MLSAPNEYEFTPAFRLAVFDDAANDITLAVDLEEDPSIKRHASMALLYGLAIMVLDRDGTVAATVDRLLEDGPINEIDAHNRIAILVKEDGGNV